MGFIQKAKKLLGPLASFLLQKRETILLTVVVIALTLLVSSLVSIWLGYVDNARLPSIGTIRTSGLQAYWNIDLTNETREIPWGELYPGSAANATLYLRSVSNIPVKLELTAANWTFRNSLNEVVYGPANSTEHMTLTWNYNGSTLRPGQVMPATLILRLELTFEFVDYIIEKDVQSFSFDINIRTLEELC